MIGEDVSGSATRRHYQVYVTSSGVGPGVTSSLFETIYDQDFTLQTANPVFDVTFGVSSGSSVVASEAYSIDSDGKYIFPSQSLMLREKISMYKEFAQQLLGNGGTFFSYTSGSVSTYIHEPIFLCFRRLFSRDQIKRETFALSLFQTGSTLVQNPGTAQIILTDANSAVNKDFSYGGEVSAIVNSSNTTNQMGLLFIDKGVAVLDSNKIFCQTNAMTGIIDAANAGGVEGFNGTWKKLLYSASMDDVLDHVCVTRFTASMETVCTFQNITTLHSTLYFCRAAADEFNYSSNPTYTDSSNRVVVIDEGQEEKQRSFTYISSIGLYDAHDNLLAVAKLSRPVLKDNERDLTFRARSDC